MAYLRLISLDQDLNEPLFNYIVISIFFIIAAGTMEKCAAEGTYGIAVEISSFIDFIKYTAADGEFCDNV